MFKSLKSIALAGTLALGAFAATSTTASAGDVRIGVDLRGPGFDIGIGDRYFRGDRRRDRHYRTCSPRKALRKARRNGVRRAHIRRIGHRGVIVSGRKWGERVVMGFGKHRSCPIRFVRARY
ncbi:hypothetical protein ACFQ14_07930 [Pseudahrensia aquimaris]|uniref:Antifreeze protein n=1 Tax=Pseudahrensia aquimaris TaxID=744461 RepID=A0ABW3FDQ5_9HYPH